MSETDTSNDARHPRSRAAATEEKLRNRLYELAMKVSEKETSSGDDQESEPKTESQNPKESLSSEDNSQGVQEELKKVSTVKPPVDSLFCVAGVRGKFYICAEVSCAPKELSFKCLSCAHGRPQKPQLFSTE